MAATMSQRECSQLTKSQIDMECSVSWTGCRGDNRSVGWFQGFFQSAFHPGWTAKFPQNRQIACGSAVVGDECGDGERAVATPLFDGKRRPGAFGFRSA